MNEWGENEIEKKFNCKFFCFFVLKEERFISVNRKIWKKYCFLVYKMFFLKKNGDFNFLAQNQFQDVLVDYYKRVI